MAVERRARQLSKGLKETILKLTYFFLDGHVSDQGQVKGKNGVFQFWEPGDAAFNSFDPNSAKVLPRVW